MSCLLFTWQAFLTLARDIKAKMDTKLVGISLSEQLEFAFWAKMFCFMSLFSSFTQEGNNPQGSNHGVKITTEQQKKSSFFRCVLLWRPWPYCPPPRGWTWLDNALPQCTPPLSSSVSLSFSFTLGFQPSGIWSSCLLWSSSIEAMPFHLPWCHCGETALVVQSRWRSDASCDLLHLWMCVLRKSPYLHLSF